MVVFAEATPPAGTAGSIKTVEGANDFAMLAECAAASARASPG
jgi:hypothetical protein